MAVKNVEITTAHNIRIDYELASVSDRIIAYVIDLSILIGWLILLFLIATRFDFNQREVIVQLGFLPVFFLYHLVCEAFFGGQSIGKRAMSLKIVKMNGQNPGLGDCLLRWSLRMIDIMGTSGILAAILVSSTDFAQRLGDMAANTVVIRLNPPNRYTIADILTIKSQSDYKPTYTSVTVFTDEDMLLVKNAIERVKLHPNENNKKLLRELTEKVRAKLQITNEVKEPVTFLRTILQDYIVLTR